MFGHLKVVYAGISDGRVRVSLEVSSEDLMCPAITSGSSLHIDGDIGVPLVKRHALVINIFERVVAGDAMPRSGLMKFDDPVSSCALRYTTVDAPASLCTLMLSWQTTDPGGDDCRVVSMSVGLVLQYLRTCDDKSTMTILISASVAVLLLN